MIIKPGYAGLSFELPDNAIIADIGSGHHPLPEATYCIERDLEESTERCGNKTVIPNGGLILADISNGIPLPDKSCDFVVASHILEHVNDPVAFCNELMRIGKAGYIETPGPWQEWFDPKPDHKWVITNKNGMLHFRKNSIGSNKVRNRIAAFIIDIIQYNFFSQTTYYWKDKICISGIVETK